MNKSLVIVESPAKAKKLASFLGKDYHVLASYGHVRDLRPKEGAVDPNNQFAMHYQVVEKNSKHLDNIIKAMKAADALFLATDPDREGEAISWHIAELLKEHQVLGDKTAHSIIFHEITKTAIKHAIEHPRSIAMDLVNAQQSRRALDYLVGFTLSPLLWKKIRGGLSAGRVQSPALRMIVEREEEIEKFIQQEYWSIIANAEHATQPFQAKLSLYQNEKMSQFSITDAATAGNVKQNLLAQAQGELLVDKVEKKQRKRNPSAPFITSTLQQEAARKLGFTTQRTMRVAQQLYEAGIISYMRTDSVNLAQEALIDIRELISQRYGADNVPSEARIFRTKTKNAQEAHEAIRPTEAKRIPEELKQELNDEQFKLYNLIWQRTIACQMIHATLDTVGIDLRCGQGNLFRATGSTVTIPGFLAVYQEGHDDVSAANQDELFLPIMQEGDKVKLLDICNTQHFTEPPPRYTEASLVKALEEYGIGRPSTYASIISTLQSRGYVELDKKRFQPTDVGRVVNRFLTKYFTQYVDYAFTAKLEDTLDEISRGEKEWIPLLKEFWQPFSDLVSHTQENVQRKDVTQEMLDEKCPKCSKPLSIRLGKRGRFVGCTSYPECDYTANLDGDETNTQAEVIEDRNCPKCSEQLLVKQSRYGKFIGCAGYPKCKHIEPLEQPKNTGVTCCQCKQGTMVERRSRRGKVFFSCSKYPTCDYAVWNEPTDIPCPSCHWPMLTIKASKRKGNELVCPQKECGYTAPYETQESTP
jgi:DNA topoisomerase I